MQNSKLKEIKVDKLELKAIKKTLDIDFRTIDYPMTPVDFSTSNEPMTQLNEMDFRLIVQPMTPKNDVSEAMTDKT